MAQGIVILMQLRMRQLSLFTGVTALLLTSSSVNGELILRLNTEVSPKTSEVTATSASPTIDVPTVRTMSFDDISTSEASSGAPAKQGRVLNAPAAPGSLQLMLSALMSVGAWQITRFAGKIQGSAPDWYHTGGPAQVGHATPFDLTFECVAPIPLAISDNTMSVVAFAPKVTELTPQDEKPALASPRGPPRL